MKTLVTFTAAIAAITSIAVAQTPTQTPAQGQTMTPVQTPAQSQQMQGGMTPASATGATAESASRPIDASEFVNKAASGGLYEVQSSQMATTATQNQQIQQVAQKIISDHQAANQELKQIAAGKNLQVPTSLDDKHRQMINQLQNAQGAQFDSTYVRQQQMAHQEAIQLFQRASTQLDDAELKAFATKTLPVLQQHAEMLNSLQSGQGNNTPVQTNN